MAESPNLNKITVIIPTYNEARNIGELLKVLFELYPEINVIVADDESSDGTQKVVVDFTAALRLSSERLLLLERKGANIRGLTASVLDGLVQATTPFLAVMDGDLQHPPAVLGQLYNKIAAGADLAIGARNPYKENQGLHRIAVTRIATGIAKTFLRLKGLKITDPMSGFFVMRAELLAPLTTPNPSRFEPRGYKVLFDILKQLPASTKIEQVLYQFAFRGAGKSKLRPAHAICFLKSLLK